MDQGINSYIREKFSLEKKDIKTYSPLSLAYVGDCIYELCIRSLLVDKGNMPVNKLHKESVRYVSAKAQNIISKKLYEEFNDKEKELFRRGKNTKMNSMAKNATPTEYRNATGFETVLGYLYLTDDTERLFYLVKKAIEAV